MSISKVILITGGTSGIGRETALLLTGQGHRVFVAARRPPLDSMPGITYIRMDVRQPDTIRACVREVLSQAGRVDVLVNNAGYAGPAGASEEVSMEEVRALFETNFFGMVQMVNTVLPGMRERGDGLIINLSSAAGRMALPSFWNFYVASKHALEGYSEGLAGDLRAFGIRVAIIEPGYHATRLHTTFQQPANPLPAFNREREHALAVDSFSIRYGRDPRLVAELIGKLVNQGPRKLRYPIGLDIQFIMVFRRLLSDGAFEWVRRWLSVGGQPVTMSDDDDTIRRKIGLRRYLLESHKADQLWRGFLVFVAVVLIGVLVFAIGR